MATPPGEEKPTPESIAAYVKSNAANAKRAQEMHHGESLVTRETDYKGHHIVVRTKYEVEVDGKPLMGHLGVSDAGAVHYHPVPNMSFASALDMVKKIIDVFPDEFGPDSQPNSMPPMNGAMHKMGRKTMRTKMPSDKTMAKKRRK